MKKYLIGLLIFSAAILQYYAPPVGATPGATTLVFQCTSTAVPSTPNVRVCVMNAGMARDFKNSGIPIQTVICDSITGYYLTKSLTVSLTGAQYFYFQVDQDTLFNHTGHATNALKILDGEAWGESVR